MAFDHCIIKILLTYLLTHVDWQWMRLMKCRVIVVEEKTYSAVINQISSGTCQHLSTPVTLRQICSYTSERLMHFMFISTHFPDGATVSRARQLNHPPIHPPFRPSPRPPTRPLAHPPTAHRPTHPSPARPPLPSPARPLVQPSTLSPVGRPPARTPARSPARPTVHPLAHSPPCQPPTQPTDVEF